MRTDEIAIPVPCPIDLRELVAGADERFHCDHCDREVHVLSHMSPEAAAQIMARRQRDNLCVAFVHRRDGELEFREHSRDLVPATRLRGAGKLLRASALALSVAACSTDNGSAALGVGGGAPPRSNREVPGDEPCDPKPEQTDERHGADERDGPDERELEVLGGAPPILDTQEQGLADVDPELSAGPRRVEIDELSPRRTPQPPIERLLRTKAGRAQDEVVLSIEHCVDPSGAVVDATLLSGDREVGKIVIDTMTRSWRYKPYLVDGEAVRVCTDQVIRIALRVEMQQLPS